jgi:transcriptional regulator of arginine metabolism
MPWRPLVPDLLSRQSIATQEELVAALADRGHEVNQATVSRELKKLGVAKVEGAYRLPVRAEVGAPIHAFTTTAGDCIAVVHTEPAFAMVLAQAIDAEELDGVLGTVAGDDTVFVATTGKAPTRRLRSFLGLKADRPRETRR